MKTNQQVEAIEKEVKNVKELRRVYVQSVFSEDSYDYTILRKEKFQQLEQQGATDIFCLEVESLDDINAYELTMKAMDRAEEARKMRFATVPLQVFYVEVSEDEENVIEFSFIEKDEYRRKKKQGGRVYRTNAPTREDVSLSDVLSEDRQRQFKKLQKAYKEARKQALSQLETKVK